MRQFERPDGYVVYEDGSIRGVRGWTLKQSTNTAYRQVDLRGHRVNVHRIVAEAFLPNPLSLPCINHKDGDKWNNHVSNLEWCSYSENSIHAYAIGLRSGQKGETNGTSKLKDDDVRAIRAGYASRVRGWQTEMAAKYGVSETIISYIVNWKTYKHVR